MPDSYTNARPYFDVTFPSSGDGFSIAGFRNALAGLGFLDHIPLQPRAHNPANLSIMVRGQDAAQFYTPVYFGNADQRIPFASGDTANFAVPAGNPRIDIVYCTPSGDYKVQQGTEAASPTLPSLAPSGDTRFPIAAVWCKPGMTKVVNFEDKDSNSGDGYIYKDLRPWMRNAGAGATSLTAQTALSVTGDNAVGTASTAARADHTHQGVHAFRKVGSSNIYGDVEISGSGDGIISQSGNRITIQYTDQRQNSVVQIVHAQDSSYQTTTTVVGTKDADFPNTEGAQFLSVEITPRDSKNRHLIDVTFWGCENTNTGSLVKVGVFKDAVVNAIANAVLEQTALSGANGEAYPIVFKYLTDPVGTTNKITYKVRGGCDVGQFDMNGGNGSRTGAGVQYSTITVTELKG